MDFMVALPTIVKAMAMGAVPILLAALGEVFSERAGLVNIGLEGIMAVGAFVAFAVGKVTGNLWIGLLAGMAAGVAVNMIYAFCAITLCSDQTVTSMAVNILAPAIALFGYNVIRVKYLACVVCGALTAAGGAFLTICYTPIYTDGIVAGRGFIALATVIFGRWSAVGVMLASLLFGFFDGLNVALQASFQSAPVMFFKMIPYVFTIIALMFFGSKHGGPKACGKPYFRESR